MPDIYEGNQFSVARDGNDWTIWRITNDDGDQERIILETSGMDELQRYFDECYAEDRDA